MLANYLQKRKLFVQGTVTSAAGVFFDAFYLQDETGGIMAFNEVPESSLKEGDIVRVYGHIDTYEGDKEVIFGSFNSSVVKISEGEPLQPTMMSTADSNLDSNQGQFVKLVGEVKDASKSKDSSPILCD